MSVTQPETKLDTNFSSPNAAAVPWSEGSAALEQAEIYWVTTIRPEGRPHVTPLLGVFIDGAVYFTTGEGERKAKNLANNAQCVISTGCNKFLEESLDVIVEGAAVSITDNARLQRIADAIAAKYGEGWRFEVRDGSFVHSADADRAKEGETAKVLVFEVTPVTAFGYGRGAAFSQTRWRF